MVILLLAHGIFIGGETAIRALKQIQPNERIPGESRRARAIALIQTNSERLLVAFQVSAAISATTLIALTVYNLHDVLQQLIAQISILTSVASELSLFLLITILSLLIVIIGTLVPKALARHAAPAYAAIVVPTIYIFARIFAPILWLVKQWANLIVRLLLGEVANTETRLSSNDLEKLIDQASLTGLVHPQAGEIAVRALDFGGVVINEIMIPRTQIVAINADATFEQLRRLLLEENHSYYPVYNGTLDEIQGIISTNDILTLVWEKELIVLQDLIRPPHFVPENVRAVDVLRELQREHIQFAIVVDEHGGTAGIITTKDLIEELVGEIIEQGERSPEHVYAQRDGSLVVPGNMAIRDANRELPFELSEDEEYASVGGLAVTLAGRIPESGERLITNNGIVLEILDASPRRVRWLRFWPPPQRPQSLSQNK
ncbi:MAG: HlyC/CorC family transporter [Deltaproteobacteria bacterium]|nr:HlyC/CorC family transporter [Deltaproteobacteria bacterium]